VPRRAPGRPRRHPLDPVRRRRRPASAAGAPPTESSMIVSERQLIHVEHELVDAIELLPTQTPEDDARKFISEPYLSPSQIKSYGYCSASYMLRYHPDYKIKEPLGSRLVFGNAEHKIAQSYGYDGLIGANEDLRIRRSVAIEHGLAFLDAEVPNIQVWNPAWNRGPVDTLEYMRTSLVTIADQMLPLLDEHEPVAIEQGFVIRWRDPRVLPVLSFADRIARTPAGDYVVEDVKTGARAKSQKDVIYDIALMAYGPAFELATDLPVRTVGHIYGVRTSPEPSNRRKNPTVARVSVPANRGALRRLYVVAKSLTSAISGGAFLPIPDPQRCGGCGYADACNENFGELGVIVDDEAA
jgi:PD-(D/E)XK nuclease superfamily